MSVPVCSGPQYLTGWIFGRPERQRREAHFPQCLQYASHFIAVLPKDEQNNGLTQDVSLDARIRKTASRRASRATCQVLRLRPLLWRGSRGGGTVRRRKVGGRGGSSPRPFIRPGAGGFWRPVRSSALQELAPGACRFG